MIVFASVAVAANACSLIALRTHRGAGLNMRAAYLEVLSDLAAAAGVLVAAAVVAGTGFVRADAITSGLIGIAILPRTWNLLRDAADVLLEATPKGVDMEEVRRHILEVPGVIDAHDLHVWAINSGMNVVSVHVVRSPEAHEGRVLDNLCACLAEHFDIEHSTFQLELPQHREHEPHQHG